MTMMDEQPALVSNGNGSDTPLRRLEWGTLPTGFTVRRLNGLWVCTKMGVYFDTDEVMKKIRETVDVWDEDEYLQTIRLDLGLVS